jgi:hypothetical protein
LAIAWPCHNSGLNTKTPTTSRLQPGPVYSARTITTSSSLWELQRGVVRVLPQRLFVPAPFHVAAFFAVFWPDRGREQTAPLTFAFLACCPPAGCAVDRPWVRIYPGKFVAVVRDPVRSTRQHTPRWTAVAGRAPRVVLSTFVLDSRRFQLVLMKTFGNNCHTPTYLAKLSAARHGVNSLRQA